MDAAAAYADSDAAAGFKARSEARGDELLMDFGGDVGDAAVGEFLTNEAQARQFHGCLILAV
jgi:regulator of RNase E activity RraA